MTTEVPPIVTYHSNNNKPEWFAYLKLDGSTDVFGVRFEGATEEEVKQRASDWWTNEKRHQERIVGKSELEPDEISSKSYKTPIVPGSWGKPANSWGVPTTVVDRNGVEHGMSGKVWLINHVLKQRQRVAPQAVDGMLAQGWERGGPKTGFRG